jgi:hypothetical protein
MTAVSQTMNTLLAERPRYIVVFRERSERNASTLSNVLKAGEATGMSMRASCTVLQTSLGFARVYNRMSVAATNLDDDQVVQLRRDEQVRAVVLNEQRFVPRPVESASVRGAPPTAEGVPGRH